MPRYLVHRTLWWCVFAGEDDRQNLLRRLEEAEPVAALGRLAASVGHESNNPLAYVSMNVDFTVTDLDQSLEHSDKGPSSTGLANLAVLLRACRGGLDRIREVVKDLQRLSRQSEVRRETCFLNDLLDESLAMARNQVEHRARVRKLYGEIGPVVGDRSALGQVLLNLILNASEALPEGRADSNEVTLRTYMEGANVIVEVRDTGAGISPHVLPHIVDPFFTTKAIGEGTGLGLAVSSRIVADHRGRLDVESEVGRGSIVRVTLPSPAAISGETSLEAKAPVQRARAVPRARILVIDDFPALGRTISRGLAEHDVKVVARADDAFTLLEADETFDIVLCDLLMPQTGGIRVFERLKRKWPHLASNVIFMTDGVFSHESTEFLEQSSQPILTKPFSMDELRAAVRILMGDPTHGLN